jgi:hypothetical protein
MMTLRFEAADGTTLRNVASRFLAAVPDLGKKILELIDE